MNHDNWAALPNIDMHCFGCGPENEHGLKMQFESNGQHLRSRVTIPHHLRGWSNIAHGGVLSTIGDEIMAWAAIHLLKRFILTKKMEMTFLKPVTIGSRLEATGYVKERINGGNVIMACRIIDAKKDVCATGIGKFALFTAAEFERFNIVPKSYLERMVAVMENAAPEPAPRA